MIKLGVIADDFTGATDIASFMVQAGWRVVLFNGIPQQEQDVGNADAVVIALKSRSIAVTDAVAQSISAAKWLKQEGCGRIFFKYCSTFDSTPTGNIGPVTDALMKLLNAHLTLICPAVPDNGRTVVYGHLFVKGKLLNQSGMEHHPVTPMTESSLITLMETQSTGRCGLIDLDIIKHHPERIDEQIEQLRQKGMQYLVCDVLDNQDLSTIAKATQHFTLVTGAAGLGFAIAANAAQHAAHEKQAVSVPAQGGCVVLSGSCSPMTNQQVDVYRQRATSLALDVDNLIADPSYFVTVAEWAIAHAHEPLAPLIYATQPPQSIERIQKQYGAAYASEKIEQFFSTLAYVLADKGINKFIVAGGETSGAVIQGLGVSGMTIGDAVAPGVPWTQVLGEQQWVILKSGNFGDSDFFFKTQEHFK